MKLSTRGIYGLEALIYLATKPEDTYTSISEIANNRNISIKYLEQIFSTLKEAGILESARGKQGGYRLFIPANRITAYDVMKPLEIQWDIPTDAEHTNDSISHTVFANLKEEIIQVLKHYTIGDLASAYRQTLGHDFVI